MPVTNNSRRNRQRLYRERMEAEGYVQVSGWVHRDQAPDAVQLLRRLREDRALLPGPLRHSTTGRLQKLEA